MKSNNKQKQKNHIMDLTELFYNSIQSTFMKHKQSKEGKRYLTFMKMTDNKTGSPTSILDLDVNINILIALLVLQISQGEKERERKKEGQREREREY